MDDGLGYYNTEIAYRALKLGYRLMVDDTNIAKCINLWPIIGGMSQNIANRGRVLNPPRYEWLIAKMEKGEMPIVRDEKIDAKTNLPYEIPKSVKDKDCADWVMKHTPKIVGGWS
jgi:hypothetical protein